jgi:CRP-like cAMP-binding protein
MATPQASADIIVRKLETLYNLDEDERQAIRALPLQVRDLRRDQDIAREGDRPSQCCLLLEGLIYRYKSEETGKRQILGFNTPGDLPDLQSLALDELDHSIGTASAARVAFVSHLDMRRLIGAYPRLSQALWRDTLVEASIAREWLLNVGQREAYRRIAHLFCELYTRLKAVGLVHNDTFRFPISQLMLGEAVGVTSVHVNRVLQQLRKHKLVEWAKGDLEVRDWQGLVDAAGFETRYLHLKPEAVADQPLRP